MTNHRVLEIFVRDEQGKSQKLSGPEGQPYQLDDQRAIRIGAAEMPLPDISLPNEQNKLDSLHLLVRTKYNAMVYPNAIVHEIVNVSQEVIKLYRTGRGKPTAKLETITIQPNDGAVELQDFDTVEFGGGNYLLHYLTNEWVKMEVDFTPSNSIAASLANATRSSQQSQGSGTASSTHLPYKITMRQGDEMEITIRIQGIVGSSNLSQFNRLQLDFNIQGHEPSHFQLREKSSSPDFNPNRESRFVYALKCVADCQAPGYSRRLHFVVSLLEGNTLRYAVSRSALVEVVPCGPFVLSFSTPRSS